MSKSAPKPPDYGAAAQQQADSSREVTNMQTWANRPNQYTPFGSTTWSPSATVDPATGQSVTQWNQNTTLTPDTQAALDAQMDLTRGRSELGASMMGRAQNEFGTPMDWSSMPEGGGRVNPEQLQTSLDFSGAPGVSSGADTRNRAENAIYERAASRLDPRFQQQEGDMRARLYGQGLREGDAAFQREMDNFNRSREDAYQTAMNEAIMGGGQEATREFGMDTARRNMYTGEQSMMANFGNQALNQQFNQNVQAGGYNTQQRQQDIAEEMQRRGFTLNEINALISGQQVGMPSMPGFNTAQASQPVQALQAAQLTGQANLDAFNAQQAGWQGLMAGAGGFAGFSDRRLKEDIQLIGKFKGINIYHWRYVWGEEATGVMADEVEHIPGAVFEGPGGYRMVDYGRVFQ